MGKPVSEEVASSATMNRLRLWLVTFGVIAVLLFFFSVPLIFILYGGASAAVGGAVILAPIIFVQYLFIVVLKRFFPGAVQSEKK